MDPYFENILRSKILGNKLGILTYILIVMDYFFYLYISEKYLQFRGKKYINLGNQFLYKKYNERDRNISKTFVFIFHHSSYLARSFLLYFLSGKKHLLGNILVHPIQVSGSTYCAVVFQTMYTSEICT